MIVLNNKFFDGVQAFKEKYGNDYNVAEEYITWRADISAQTEALKAKYNIGQNQ